MLGRRVIRPGKPVNQHIVDCLISDPKLYAPISVTVHFMAVNSGGGRGVCIHASNSSSGDPLLTAGVGEQP